MNPSSSPNLDADFPNNVDIPHELLNVPGVKNASIRLKRQMRALQKRFKQIDRRNPPSRAECEAGLNCVLAMYDTVTEQLDALKEGTTDAAATLTLRQKRQSRHAILNLRLANSKRKHALQSDLEQCLALALRQRERLHTGLMASFNQFTACAMQQAEYARSAKLSDKDVQFRWRWDSIARYEHANGPVPLHRSDRTPGIWDPILKRMLLPSTVTAAHIVPHAMGPEAAGYLFGEADGDAVIWDHRNCIPMLDDLEQMFDAGWWALTPVTPLTWPTEFRFVLLKHDESDTELDQLLDRVKLGVS